MLALSPGTYRKLLIVYHIFCLLLKCVPVTLFKGILRISIFGPVLFNVYINDIFYFTENCILYNYADNTSLSKSAPDVYEMISCLHDDDDNVIVKMRQ